MHRLASILILLCISCTACGTEVAAGDSFVPANTKDHFKKLKFKLGFEWGNGVSGPICGPYAACAAMRRLGADVLPKSFVKAKYIGTCEGTTQTQLVAAIEDSGYLAYPVDALSVLDLAIVDLPFVALVRPSSASNRYSHWVTVEHREGNFLVLDSGRKPYELTPAEFMGLWSGAGVFVASSEHSSPMTDIFLLRLALLLAALGLSFLICWTGRRLSRPCEPLAESTLLAGLTLAICFGALILFGDIKNYRLGLQVATAPYTRELKPISINEAVLRSREQGSLLIDARREVDFAADAIEGAINLPIYAARDDAQQLLQGIDKSIPIYIYCQSAQCDYDDTVGRLIASLGYEQIFTCSEGIYEYQESAHQAQTNE